MKYYQILILSALMMVSLFFQFPNMLFALPVEYLDLKEELHLKYGMDGGNVDSRASKGCRLGLKMAKILDEYVEETNEDYVELLVMGTYLKNCVIDKQFKENATSIWEFADRLASESEAGQTGIGNIHEEKIQKKLDGQEGKTVVTPELQTAKSHLKVEDVQHPDKQLRSKKITGHLFNYQEADYLHAIVKSKHGNKQSFFVDDEICFISLNHKEVLVIKYDELERFFPEGNGYYSANVIQSISTKSGAKHWERGISAKPTFEQWKECSRNLRNLFIPRTLPLNKTL